MLEGNIFERVPFLARIAEGYLLELDFAVQLRPMQEGLVGGAFDRRLHDGIERA